MSEVEDDDLSGGFNEIFIKYNGEMYYVNYSYKIDPIEIDIHCTDYASGEEIYDINEIHEVNKIAEKKIINKINRLRTY